MKVLDFFFFVQVRSHWEKWNCYAETYYILLYIKPDDNTFGSKNLINWKIKYCFVFQ